MLRPPRSCWLLLAGLLACEAGAATRAEAPKAPPAPAPAPAPTPAPPPAHAPVGPYLRAAGVDYLEVVHVKRGTPAAAVPGRDAALPMVVALHGRGDKPEDFQHLLDDLPVTVRLIVPRALDPLDDGWSWFPIRARSADVEALARGIAAAEGKVAALIGELQRTRPTVGRPVVTGFSQGGMLSFALAVAHPDLVAFAVPVGGWLPPPLWPPGGPPPGAPKIVALHGEADAVVRFAPTRELVDALAQRGWPVTLKPYAEVGHAIPPPMRRELHLQLQQALEAKP